MKILQFLKNIFSKSKIKAIAASKEEIKENSQRSDVSRFIQQYRVENNAEKKDDAQNNVEKVKKLLKKLGCTDETINSIYKIDRIDINNLKNNIMTFIGIGVTKLQLANIIGNNWATLYMKNDDLKNTIESIKKFSKDDNIVKEMIVRNSNVISKDTEYRLNKTKEILDEFCIPSDSQIQILEENPAVMLLPETQLSNSLTLIRKCVDNDEQFINEITIQPIIVGLSQIQLIKNYINSLGKKWMNYLAKSYIAN